MSSENGLMHLMFGVIMLIVILAIFPIILNSVRDLSPNGTGTHTTTSLLGGNQVTATVVQTVGCHGCAPNTIVVQYNYNGVNHSANVGVSDNPHYSQSVCVSVDGSGNYQSLVKESAC